MSISNYPFTPTLYTSTVAGPTNIPNTAAGVDVPIALSPVFPFNDLQGYTLDMYGRAFVNFPDVGGNPPLEVNKFQLAVCRCTATGEFQTVLATQTLAMPANGDPLNISGTTYALTANRGALVIPENGTYYVRLFIIYNGLEGSGAVVTNSELSVYVTGGAGYARTIVVS